MVIEKMSKRQAQVSMARHRKVTKLLQENLPGCEITYDGCEGIDHIVVFNGKPTYIEVKTCNKIIKKTNKCPQLGRFKFNTAKKYPYTVSQHDDLVKDDGWYIFVVASGNQYSEITGIAAKEIKLGDSQSEQRVSWCNVMNQCYPDWLRRLKISVYGV